MYYTTDGGNSWTVPNAAFFKSNGLEVRASYKIGTRIVSCVGYFNNAAAALRYPIYVSNSLGVAGSWSYFGTTPAKCQDMLFLPSINTFVAAMTGIASSIC